MLATPVGINGGASSGSSVYTFNLFFSDNLAAKYLAVGDVVTATSGDRYQITTFANFPNDFSSGAQVTTTALDADQVPVNDGGFTSSVATPGQKSLETPLVLDGSIGGISVFSGQNYEYELSVSWDDPVLALSLVTTDSIVDNNGKEFEIVFIDPTDRFLVPFRIREKEKIGALPAEGRITAYRPSENWDFYQGSSSISDSAKNRIRNRDANIVDENLGQGGSGGGSNGDYQSYEIDLDAAKISAKQVTLNPAPIDPSEVTVFLLGAGVLDKDKQYTISGSVIDWSGTVLDGLLDSGSTFRVTYYS